MDKGGLLSPRLMEASDYLPSITEGLYAGENLLTSLMTAGAASGRYGETWEYVNDDLRISGLELCSSVEPKNTVGDRVCIWVYPNNAQGSSCLCH